MNTRVYIDGYNFYYGCLKGTPYKWLDLVSLFNNYILPSSIPENISQNTAKFKYFTADISEKAAKSPDSVKDQESYHRALKALYPEEQFATIKGNYSIIDTYAYLVDKDEPKKHPKNCERVKIWKIEEKKSDVNLAVEALYDVLTDTDIDHVVFVTNDTDLEPVLEKIKQLDRVKIGLVIPSSENQREPNAALIKHASWTRRSISHLELKSAQMPRVISASGGTRLRKAIVKPNGWYGSPQLVSQILNTLEPVLNNTSNCWQWLSTPKPDIPSLPMLNAIPYEMLDNEEDAKKVLKHAISYANHKKGL